MRGRAHAITPFTGLVAHVRYNYFQGMAVSYKLAKRWTLDGFYSYRKMDGIVAVSYTHLDVYKRQDILRPVIELI